MPTSTSDSTLEHFRSTAASAEPVPAAVTVSAVSASFALGLLAKVLQISGRRKDFAGDLGRVETLVHSAGAASKRMLQYAEQDIVAFNAYIQSARLPQGTDAERAERKRAIDAAVRRAIEIPWEAARAASTGIGLCVDAVELVHVFVAADLGAAAALLSGALRVFLLCSDSNMRQMASDPSAFRSEAAGRAEIESRGFRQADSVLRLVTSTIDAAGSIHGLKS
jgi:formiminotetrahydrofolate cyclodeaminase